MATYYKQFMWSTKKEVLKALKAVLDHTDSKERRVHLAGIPEFEFRSPEPQLVQGEIFKFTQHRADEPIGYDFQKHKDRFPFQIARELKMDRAADKAKGFNNFRSFPHNQLNFNVEVCKSSKRFPGMSWQEDVQPGTPDFPEVPRRSPIDSRRLNFFDRLALGDTSAGHLLYLIETEFGSIRFT